MARKQFVSSKKNAPSRAVSSKEAALHGRVGDATSGGDEDEEVDVDDDDDDSSGSDTPGSPASSNGSSSLFTSDEQDEAIGNGGGDVDTPSQSSEAPVAVEVMPSSVGRGKQLRFPTVISRGKESRVFTQDGSQDEDGDSDSDDSLLSIASDEEEEDDKSSVDGAIPTQQVEQQQHQEDTAMLDDSELTTASTKQQQNENDSPSAAAGYPIKGFRARKRHRPDSGYYKQMSTYVRDCLLSVRDGAEAADVFTEESHDEFRRKLSAGTVERVAWKESSPPAEEPVAAPAAAAAVVTKSIAPVVSEKKKEESPADQVKKEKHKKEHRTKEKRSESSSGGTSGSKSSSSSSSRKREEAPASSSSSSSRKREEAAASTSSSASLSRPKETPEPVKSVAEVKKEEVKKEIKREERSVSSSSLKAEPAESTRKIKTESTSTTSSSGRTSSSGSSSSNGASSSSAAAAADKSKSTTGGSAQQTPALCSSCKKELSDDKEPEKPPPALKKTVTIAPEAKAEQLASFIIPTVAGKDVAKLRAEATKLNDEARALKHEGNRKGAAEPGAAGQIAQGKFYLRSSAKFFQHALKLADIKAAYKEVGDERHARQYGDYSVTTLSQTSSLIESTIRTFQSAGSARMVALGYKLASIVHLTIYRLQHLKLFSLYSDLFTPGRSPDTRQNGTPTPPIGGTNDSNEAAVRTHLLKEMEHTLRGFEMWRRYETCKVVVLPRITNPAIADLSVLFEDLRSELGSA